MTRTRIAAPQFTNAAEAHDVAQLPDVELTREGTRQEALDVAPAIGGRDVEAHAFMEQRVTILVHEDPTPGAIETLVLNVNGEDAVIPRGRSVDVKRKFVQQLLDMRETRFSQPARNPHNVEGGNRLIPKTALLYPFAVERDPNPNGLAWLQNEQRRAFSMNLR